LARGGEHRLGIQVLPRLHVWLAVVDTLKASLGYFDTRGLACGNGSHYLRGR